MVAFVLFILITVMSKCSKLNTMNRLPYLVDVMRDTERAYDVICESTWSP